jgi:hypothetical protein
MGDFKKKDNINQKGWDAIEEAVGKLYQGSPIQIEHYGVLQPWRLGGNDPLDGISIYDGGEYYHFVTFGLSELYEKETKDPEYSGFGFELTIKLKKSCVEDEEGEMRCMAGILQAVARISYKQGDIFAPEEYIYTGQNVGMDLHQKSLITGFITKEDELGEIVTENGKVQFVQLIGATDAELKQLVDKKLTVSQLAEKIGTDLTDYHRKSVF